MPSPTYTQDPARLWRMQTDPVFHPKTGELQASVVESFFKSRFTNEANPAEYFDKDLGSVRLDCFAEAQKPVIFTFDGQTYTLPLGACAAGMAQAAKDAWNAQV